MFGCKLEEAHMWTLLHRCIQLSSTFEGFNVCARSCHDAGNHLIIKVSYQRNKNSHPFLLLLVIYSSIYFLSLLSAPKYWLVCFCFFNYILHGSYHHPKIPSCFELACYTKVCTPLVL